MRAAVFRQAGQPLEILQVPDPEPSAREIVLRIKACGVCGSDLHMSEVCDRAGGMAPLPDGAIMGHEFAGEIVEVGNEASSLWQPGERVCALPYIGCGKCVQCLSGNGHRCPDVVYGGLGRLDGAYAEYARVGMHEALRLPTNVDYRSGALVEPLSVGLHAVNRSRLKSGDAVLIVGAGPVGLAVALWCRFFGARRVVVTDLKASRVEKAASVGATDGIDASKEDVIGRFKQISGNRPDVVFDCVGVPGSQQLAMDYAPMDGRVIVVGVCMQPDTTIPVKAITKELTVVYVFMYRKQDFQMTLDMLGRERIDPSAMVTDVVGFDHFSEAFEALKRPTLQCKVVLDPELAD